MGERFEKALVEHCSPTLAGMKPASLFRMVPDGGVSPRVWAEVWDRRLRAYGVRVRCLKECPVTGACMVYVYRGAGLSALLRDEDNRRFLRSLGYMKTDIPHVLERLSRRLCLDGDFPHEVGLLLGYPLEDVIGFIENAGRNFTHCGCWKSYGDPEKAKRCSERYHRCTAVYKRMYGLGVPLTELIA